MFFFECMTVRKGVVRALNTQKREMRRKTNEKPKREKKNKDEKESIDRKAKHFIFRNRTQSPPQVSPPLRLRCAGRFACVFFFFRRHHAFFFAFACCHFFFSSHLFPLFLFLLFFFFLSLFWGLGKCVCFCG
eukprot:TRINITY_DN4960_c0_g2_i1.p7 TRINITY_DN4960_c0_g2~~TRINITY_DN4960_c0_g2_i1.p7  ORF type:complete len:132 (-),score=4.15 TRINITY_DN4960_c0_g2_i1:186-581(-)